MMQVFADTSYYHALFYASDNWHRIALESASQIAVPIVTTDYVLLELGALMSRGPSRHVFSRFVRQLRADPRCEVVSASAEIFNGGLALFEARPDKEWSLTDCISLFVMEQRDIREALTFDRHFEQAGCRTLRQ